MKTEKHLNEQLDKYDVTQIIVKSDMCIGCGICAGICPSECLEMQWSSKGELIPVKLKECCQQCGICIKVCPFSGSDINQDKIAMERFGKTSDIGFRPETGYYLKCYAGYSLKNNQRERGASGGMATWFLQTLLESKIVDGVICVANDSRHDSDRLFRFKVISDLVELHAAAKSKYYPVEISEVIRMILHEKEEKRYAVIGVPCLIFGLNLAKKKNKKLDRQLIIMLSLACGQLPNRFYTDFLSIESGVPVNSLKSVDYRIKQRSTNPGNFAFCAFSLDRGTGKNIHWLSSPSHLWHNFYFVHNACNYCDDVFGETADVVFMDAWLSDYTKDPKGHSLIIVRSQKAYEIFQAGERDRLCYLEKISVDKVIQSQLGGIYKKRYLIQGRLYKAKLLKKWVPVKRVKAKAKVYYQNYLLINLNEKIISESKRLWPYFHNDDNTNGFMNAMRRCEMYIRFLQIISVVNIKFKKLLRDPIGVSSRAMHLLVKRLGFVK